MCFAFLAFADSLPVSDFRWDSHTQYNFHCADPIPCIGKGHNFYLAFKILFPTN